MFCYEVVEVHQVQGYGINQIVETSTTMCMVLYRQPMVACTILP